MEVVESVGNGKVRVNIWITKQMYDFLTDCAAQDARSMSDVMRVALKDFMLKEQRKAKREEE